MWGFFIIFSTSSVFLHGSELLYGFLTFKSKTTFNSSSRSKPYCTLVFKEVVSSMGRLLFCFLSVI